MSLSTWLRTLVAGSPRKTIRRISRKNGNTRSKIDLLLEQLEERLVPAVNIWKGTDAFPTFNQGLVGQYWQGANGGSGGTGNYTETYSTMILKSAGSASWIGSSAFAPANINGPNTTTMTGVIDFPQMNTLGFTDSLGTTYFGPYPGGTFAQNPSDGNNYDNIYSRWSGFINIPNNGVINSSGSNPIAFRIGSDDGSVLYIDGGTSTASPVGGNGTNFTVPGSGTNPQINNASYQGVTFRTVTLNLTPGLHSIDVEYFQGGGGEAMYFNWDPTGGSNFTDIPNSYYSTQSTATTYPGGGTFNPLGNNWSDANNWSLGRAPQNGDTVEFSTQAASFNPNNYAGTGSQITTNELVSFTAGTGNVQLNYGAALGAQSDILTFSPSPGSTSLTYNTTGVSNSDMVAFQNGTGTTSFTYNGAASAADFVTFSNLNGATAFTYNGASSSQDMIAISGSGTLQLAYNGDQPNTDTVTLTAGTSTFSYNGSNGTAGAFAYSAATTPAQFQAYLASLPGLAAPGAVIVTGNTGGPFTVAFGHTVLGGVKLTAANGTGTANIVSPSQTFAFTPSTTAAQLQTYLLTLPGLAGSVAANGNNGGPFNVTFANDIKGGNLLSVVSVVGGSASVTQAFANTPATTAAQFQSYLNSISGLNAVQVAFGSTSGNVTLAYGGVSAPTSFSFSPSTTPTAFQTYLNTIPGFTGALVTGPNGGPFVVNFASPYTGGTLLSVVAGSATVTGGIVVAGNAGGPFSVTFNTAAGIAGGTLLSAPPSGALITQTFQNTPATTAAALQTYLASIPALSAPGAVSVNGPNGGPFNVNFGPSLAGGNLLSENTSNPDNAIITPGFFYNASTTTPANVQAYLASIPGLTTPNAVAVDAYVAQVNGGPYTVSYGNGIAGDPNLAVVGGNASSTVLTGATIIAQPALALTTSTTAAQFLNYLQSIPGLQVPGSVTVTGSNGGPFTVSSALFSATNQLSVNTGSPAIISLLPGAGAPGAGIWNPINDMAGLTLNGIVIINNGYVAPGSGAVNPDPWVLTGNTVVINNTDTSLTQGISNSTVLYPNLPGLNPGGISPVTSVISLGVSPQTNGAGGPIKFLSPVTISDVGPAPLNATLTQDSLIISSSIDLSGNKLTVGPSTGSATADTGLTNITGAITNSFLATNLNGTNTFAFAGSAAPATVVPSGTASNITNASFTYNGLGSATDTITGALPGNVTFSYNSVAGSAIAYQPFSGDLLSFSSPGTVTFSYNGTAASSALTYSATTTAANVQTNLQTIAALNGKVTVTGPIGGPFIVSFDPTLAGGSLLTVVNGSGVAALSVLTNTDLVNFPATGVASLAYNGANGIPFSYTAATTTAAQFAAYLTSIGGLNTATLSFPATGGATILNYNGTPVASFTYSSSTTAASIQTLLQAVAGLGANATVSGPNGGPFTVTFANGASSSLLTVTSGPGTLSYPVFVTGAAGGPFTVYYNSGVTGGTALTVVGGSITPTVAPAATTAAQIQASLAGIAALSAAGAVTVTGSAGGPYTVTFGPGITGNNLLTVSSGGTSASITQTFATFTYSPSTTSTQFQAYLASIPGLAAPGAVTVSGSPSSFTITFGPGLLGGSLLSLVSGALTLTQGSSFNFSGGSTTAAQFQAYLATIPGLTGAGAVTVVGPIGGPFNLYFGSGVNGNLLKVISGSATLGQTTTDSVLVNSFGALDLGGANTYDGPTTVNSGLLVDGAANALGATFSQSKTVNGLGNPLPGLGNTVGAALGLATGGDSATYNFATATLTGASGNVALQYAGQQAATDTINLTAASGSMTLNYNGATSNAASLTFASLNDTVAVTGAGTVTFSYNGITGGPFAFSAATTQAQLQTYFSSIPGLTANGAVTVAVTTAFTATGGTFVLSFGSGLIGGSLLTAANGTATAAISQATTNDSISLVTPGSVVFTYSGAAGAAITVGSATTAAQIQANLAAITGLTAAGAVTVTGNNGGPFTVAFGSGIAGGSLLTVASSATNPGAATIATNSNSVTFSYDSGSGAVAGAPLIYTTTPTQAQVLAALQSVPGLTASGAVAVSGNTGGPFTITFGVGLAGASKLTVATTSGAVGSAALAAATSLAFSSTTTAAQVQNYINSIPGLITGAAGTGAASVTGTTGTGPFTVSFSGAVGGTLLTAPSGQATVTQFVFTTGTPASTTAAQLQTYIQSIPGLNSATVVGAVGGPFNIFFPAGVVGFSQLTNLTPGAITIVSGGNGITLNGNGISTLGGGVLTNADGNSNTFAAPITLTGTSTIASSTGSMTLSGPLAVGTNALTLGGTSNFTLSGPITGNGGSGITKVGIGTATIAHDNSAFGTGSTGYVGPITAQAGILSVTANNALGGIYDKVTPDYAGPTTFTYNGAQSTNNTLTLNAPTGTMTLAYNGVQSNSDLLTFASNDTVTLSGPATGAGTVTFSYNGVAATSAILITLGASGTTAAQLQTNLRTIPALSAVVVTGAQGGPFTISYAPGVVGGNLLTVVNGSGSATIAQAATTSTVFLAYNGANAPGSLSYTSGSTTAAALQAYLVTIPGLTTSGAVSVSGSNGGPFTVNFGSGIAGGSLLTAVYGSLAIAPSQSLVFNNSTTAANIQSYLQSLPGLAAAGAVSVTGYLGGGLSGSGLAGGPFLITLNPANANVAFTGPSTFSYLGTAASAPFAYTSSSTAAQFQAYLATIPGLTAAGAVFVSGAVGGPFSVSFGSGITGGTSLSASSGATVTLPTAAALTAVNNSSGAITLAAAPSFQFTPNTTAAQFATFLGSIPGINASFALPSVAGNIGGPYYVTFGTGIPGGAQLAATGSATTVASTAANTVTVDNATQNGSQFGASLGVNNVNYSTPQPVTLSGQGALTGFSIVSTISTNNPGNADYLVITSSGAATFTYNSVANPNPINLQTGSGGTSAATVQANLQSIPGTAGGAAPLGAAGAVVVTGPNGGPFFITFGPGVTGGINATTGLSIAGPATLTQLANADTITFPTFPATGSITYAYNSSAASTSFSYSPTTTAAQLQTYLATVPGLTGTNAVTVVQQTPTSAFTVLFGSGITGGNLLTAAPTNIGAGSIVTGALSGGTQPGSFLGLGGTATWAGLLINAGGDEYLGTTGAGTVTLLNNNAPISVASNNLYLQGTNGAGLFILSNNTNTPNVVGSSSNPGGIIVAGVPSATHDSIVKNGISFARLTQSNPNFNGNIWINAGVLQASSNQSFGDGVNSAVTIVNSGGGVGLFNANGFNYSTPQALTILGSGVNGALESFTGNNTYTGVLNLTGPTTLASDANTLTLTANIVQNTNLTFSGSGNIVFAGVLGSGTATSTPGIIESQSNIAYDLASATGNLAGTDQVLYPVMATTTSNVPGTYGYYAVGQHIWSNSDTWFYQGLFNLPSFVQNTLTPTSGAVTLAYNGISGASIPNISGFASTDLFNYLAAITPAAQLSFTGSGNVILGYNGVNAALPVSNLSTAAQVLAALNTIPALNGLVTVPVGNVGGPFSIETSSSNVTLAYIIAATGPATVNPPLPIPANQLNTAQGPVPAGSSNFNTSGTISVTGGSGSALTVGFPTGLLSGSALTIASGTGATRSVLDTKTGYVSFAKAIDDGAQVLIDGQKVLSATVYNSSLGSGELTLASGLHSIDLRVSNGGGGAGADASNTNGWKGFAPVTGGNNVIGTPYFNGLVFRLDQGPNDPAGTFVGSAVSVSGSFPNGGAPGTATTGGNADAFTDYTIPFDPGNGSIFSVPITLSKTGSGNLTLTASNTTKYPINVSGGQLIAANNNALGDPNNTPLKGTFANTVSNNAAIGLLGVNTVTLTGSTGNLSFSYSNGIDTINPTGSGQVTFSYAGNNGAPIQMNQANSDAINFTAAGTVTFSYAGVAAPPLTFVAGTTTAAQVLANLQTIPALSLLTASNVTGNAGGPFFVTFPITLAGGSTLTVANGTGAAAVLQQTTNTDTVAVGTPGNVIFNYNGTNGAVLNFTGTTTAAALQANLAAINGVTNSGLTAANAVIVTGNAGGPFTVYFGSGVTGGAALSVATATGIGAGTASVSLAVTTAAQLQANLQAISGLNTNGAVAVTGNAGGPFTVSFGAGITGGNSLSVFTGPATITQTSQAKPDIVDLTSNAPSGSITFSYNGVAGPALPLNSDVITAAAGNMTFSYNGVAAPLFTYAATTTAAQVLTNLASIPSLSGQLVFSGSGSVVLSYNGFSASTSVTNASTAAQIQSNINSISGLTDVLTFSGSGNSQLSYNGVNATGTVSNTTTLAQLQTNLNSIAALNGNYTATGSTGGPFSITFNNGTSASLFAANGPGVVTQPVTVTGSTGGPYSVVFGNGTLVSSLGVVSGPATFTLPVSVIGSNGGPYTVAFGTGLTGGNLATGLTVANGTGSATVASVNTTAALVQANLAAIPGLSAVGAVTVTGNNGGPFTINFGNGVVGGTLLTATGNAAITQFYYNANTTAGSLQTYLGTIPALSGNVTVTGNNGGPFTVSYGTPVLDGTLSVSGPATIVGPAGVPGSSASADLTLPATKNFSLNSAGLGNNGTIQNISGNNVIQGVIALASLISSPSTIGSLADTLNLNGTINQSSNLTFAGAGNVNVNGTINGQGSQAGLLESQASGNIFTGGQTAANLSAYGFDAQLYPWMGQTSASVPGTYGFYPTAAHIWSNNDTWLYQGFINVPNLTTDVFTAPAGNSTITMAYNGQLATTPAFNFTPATTAAQFLAYLQTLPTFPQGTLSGGVTITGPNFSTPVAGGPFYINFGSGTAAAQLLSVFSGGATISAVPTGLGYLSFAKAIDDSAWISLDGNVIINNTNCACAVGSGELTLTAGWHAIDIRVANGGGGAGANSSNANGWTNFTNPSGPANIGTGGTGGLVYRVDSGPNDPFGNTTNNGNAANYTIPFDNGTGNLFTFALTSLVMSGTGTVSLNNSQNLGNDTITVNSGTLAATVNGALGTSTANPLPINVNSGGTLALSNGVVIPANQPLSIAGGGTTTGINQNPGALVVVGPAGSTATVLATTTLLGTGATVGAQVGDTITLAGQLFGTSSANLTILGANTLPATSNGTVVLPNNSNAYLGNTIVNTGTLQITADGALGGQLSSTVTINNAILDINPTAPVTSAHGFILGNAASTVEIDGANSFTTIAAATGSGTLTKTGTGILGLGGVNTYGATVVTQGNLQALNPNALGSGRITMNGGQLTMLDNTAAQGQIALSSSSYNQDVIWGGAELINAPSVGTSVGLDGTTGNVLYQTGAIFSPSTSTGLAANGLISSQFNPLVSFQLGSYTANNVNLQITNSSNQPTASLIFQNPVSLQSLNVLAISTNGSTSYRMSIIFSDGTSDATSFTSNVVTDWFGGNGFAASGLGRISRTLGGNNAPQYLTGDTQNPRLYETDFNLVGKKASDGNLDTSKVVTQVRLTVTGQSTSGSTELGVFAVSGQVVPTTTPVLTNPVVVTSNSTIDVENNAVTLGTLTNTTNSTLTVLSTGNKALTVGNTTVSGTPVFSVGTSTPTVQPETLNLGSLNDSGTPVTFSITGAGTTNLAGAATSLVNGTIFNVAGGATLSWTNSTGPGSLATVNLASGASLGTPAGLGASATVGGLGGTIGSPSGSGSTVNLGASVLTIGNVNPVTISNSVNGAVSFSYNGVAATSSISVNSATAATMTTNLQTIPILNTDQLGISASGNVTLSFNGVNATSTISNASTAAQVLASLQTIPALATAGLVTVTGNTGGPFTLAFAAGTASTLLAVNSGPASVAYPFLLTGSTTGGPFTVTFLGAGLTGSRLAVANTTGSATISGTMQTTAFAGSIVDGTAGTAATDGVTIGYPGSTGNAATVQLTGTLTYSGPTTVNGGTLLIDTTLSNSSVTVNTGAVLGGSGPISKGITVAGGALAPGDSLTAVGTLTAAGTTTFGTNGSFDVFFTGNTQAPGGSTEANSVLNITASGTLALGTSANLVVSSNNYTANPGDVYTIISDAGGYDSTSTFATFNGIPIVNNTIIITNSSTHVQTKFTLAYNQGVAGHHDVTLTFAGTSGAAKYLVVNPNNNTISFSNPGNDLITFTSAGTVTFSYNGTAATSALTYSAATTAALVLANLQTIPALSGLTASNVTGPAGGPYSVTFTGTAANLTLLTVANGTGAASVAGQTNVIFSYNNINGSTFSYTSGVTTAAQLQANLAAIGGSNGPLSGAGAIIVTGNGTAVLPFNLSFSNTDTVALTTSGNVTFSYFGIAAPALPITTGVNGTTAAALAANLQLIPALSGSGAVTVTGNNGGPFTISYGSGVVGGPLLTVANSTGAAAVTSLTGGSLLSVNNLSGSAKLSDTIVAGTLGPVTVTAYDINNLIAPTYTGTINWTSTDAQAQSDGFLPPTYTFQSSDFGIHTFLNTASLTMITAGSQTITATDSNFGTNGIAGTNNGAAISGSNPPVQGNPIVVNALAVTSHFAITPANPPGSASLNVPKSFTVAAEDVFGNLTPGYTGTVILSSSDPLGTFSGPGINFVNSQYQATLVNGVGTFNVTFGTVGSWTINAHDSISIGSTGVSNVITIGAVPLKVVLNFNGNATATTVAGSTLTVTALATDLSGNTAVAYSNSAAVVTVVGGGGGATLPAGGLVTFNSGVATFNVIFTKVVGGPYQLFISAPNGGTDGLTTITGTSGNVSVTPSQATIFAVTAPGSTVTTGTPFNLTAQALDLYNNVVTNYTGNVKLTSTDVNASTMLQMTGLSSYTFTTGGGGADNGTHTFSVTLKTGGTQFISATDTTSTNPFISGTSGAITTRGLVVTGLTPTATGFTATFNKAFLPADVFLYNSNLTTTADVAMIGTSDTITLSSSGTLKATYNNKAATPTANFTFSSGTTSSAFAAYLATIPTLSAPGAVSVTGPNGGPFVVHFGPGLAGGTSLVVTTSAGTAGLQNVGKISGSILINPNNQSFVFKATTNNLIQKNTLNNPAGDQAYTSPVLPDSDYLIQFISGTGFGGAAVNGFFDNVGLPLDGSNNGTTTNYTTSFSTSFQANHTPVLAIPDFARGPDSSGPNQGGSGANIPTVGVPSYLNGPNTGPGADGSNAGSNPVYGSPAQSVGAGIPVVLYNATHVTDVTFTVTYNTNLFSGITGFGGPGSDAYYAPLATQNPPKGDATNNTNLVMVGSPVITGNVGVATFHYTVNTALDPTGFTATPDSPLVLGDILGVVPSGNVAISSITETGNVVTVTEAATNSFTSSLAIGQSVAINGVNATDTITFTGVSGNVKFAYNSVAAATFLAYTSATTAANVQTYLQTIAALTPAGNVTVTGNAGGPFTVSFGASVDPTKLTVSSGSTLVSIAVVASPYNSNANGNGLFTVASVNAAAHQFTYNLTTATNAIPSAGGGAGVAALGLYQQKDLLQLGAITINTNAGTGAVASNGIHVNTYLADVNGDKVIDGLDKLAANFIATATGSASVGIGFSAFTHMDPTIVGDPAGDFTVDAGDVTTIDSYVAQLNPPQIPPPPTQLLTSNPSFLNKAFISSPTAADPMISLPSGIEANAAGIVNVPVLLDHPHPEGSTGLNGASLSLTYDPTVLNLTASDITLGNIPGLGKGWELIAEVDPTTGQIGIQLFGSAPITATQAGSLVNIAFHIVPGATVSSTMVNLVNSATPNGERFETTLTDTQGGLILTEGIDRLMIVTGAADVIASVSTPVSTSTTTTEMALLLGHQVSIETLIHSFAPEASGPSSLLVGTEGGEGAAMVVLSNGVVAGESASVHMVPVNLVVTGALAFQTSTNPVAATQPTSQVLQVANISWLNLLNVSGQQPAAEHMFLATARGTDAPTELGQLSQSLNGLLWGMAAPQLDWLIDPAQTIKAPRQQDSADGTVDQQSSADSDRIAVVDQVFAELANEMDDFGDLGNEN